MVPTDDVRARIVDGLLVLLDIRSGDYVVFDRVATAMWKALVQLPDAEQLPALTRTLDAPSDRLAADFAAFTNDCVQRGFLQREAPVIRPVPPRLQAKHGYLALRAWWSLACTTVLLARRGFEHTYRRYGALPTGPAHLADERLLRHAVRRFLFAENFFLIRSAPRDCLPRSLALLRFLRSVGLPAGHRIGVTRYPFEAHAWVVSGGEPVIDQPDFVLGFAEIASL